MPPNRKFYRLDAVDHVVLAEEPLDRNGLRADQVLCRTLWSAISPGTELSAIRGEEPLRPSVERFPRLLGYMNIAEVIAAGSQAASRYPPGTIVYSHAAHCTHHMCSADDVLAAMPVHLDPRSASVAYLYRLAWVGLRRGRVEPGRDVAIVGAGAIGLAAQQLASFFGSRVLVVTDAGTTDGSAPSSRVAVTSRSEVIASHVDRVSSEDDRYDLVLVTCNDWQGWLAALGLTRYGAVVSVLGFPGRNAAPPPFNPLPPRFLYDRQLSILGSGTSVSYPGGPREAKDALHRDLAQIFAWLAEGLLDPRRLVAGTHSAYDPVGAYGRFRSPERRPGTIVLDWADEASANFRERAGD